MTWILEVFFGVREKWRPGECGLLDRGGGKKCLWHNCCISGTRYKGVYFQISYYVSMFLSVVPCKTLYVSSVVKPMPRQGRQIPRRCRCCGPLFMAFHAWEENTTGLRPELCTRRSRQHVLYVRKACRFRYMFDHFCLEMMIFFHNAPLLPLTWMFCWSTSSSAASKLLLPWAILSFTRRDFDVKYIII